MVRYYASLGVTEPMLLSYLDVASIEDINLDMVAELRGAKNAIKEGQATAKELFVDPYREKTKAEGAKKQAGTNADKARAALAKQNEGSQADMPETLM